MNVIETKEVSKIYNPDTIPVYALNKINLTIEKGEFTAIVGPSGSGKTTLLNIIGGLDDASEGSVMIDDRDILKLAGGKLIDFRLRHIGFVFQAYNLIPVLSAEENIEFIMLLQDWPTEKRENRTQEMLKAVGLEDKSGSRPSQLSGGQQQRVAVARALASKPRLVLADEPTANLDSKSAENLLDIMLKLNMEEHITFIFSTHDPRVIKRARRVITLEDGKVVSDIQQNTEQVTARK